MFNLEHKWQSTKLKNKKTQFEKLVKKVQANSGVIATIVAAID
jgi:hypothetical protein